MKARRGVFWLLLFLLGCGPAVFTSTVDQSQQGSNDAVGEGLEEGEILVPPAPVPPPASSPAPIPDTLPEPAAPLILEVSAPSPEIKAGQEKMQVKAVIKDGDPNPNVTWTIKGPAGFDLGTIDEKGLYTSPARDQDPFDIEITASLVSDPTVSDSVTIRVIPMGQIFARCKQRNEIFPILADVYEIPENSSHLPDFDSLEKVMTVCLDRYALAERRFETGFPDVPDLFEWFALKTSTTLIVPRDGSYTFRLISDDGSKLFIDGQLVIDNDGVHGSLLKEGTMTLSKGEHKLRLNYFQGPRFNLSLELFWRKPGSNSFEIVPRESFR